jgi:hypothetical protein
MNYIASFLFKITSSESEAFYLMLGLFEQTDFSLIFIEDLLRLKIFFYVFDRLLSLYLPELFAYFKSNYINVNYFCSPWFITLFTNTSTYSGSSETPEVLLRIWDDFLLVNYYITYLVFVFILEWMDCFDENKFIPAKNLRKFTYHFEVRQNSNLPEYHNMLKFTKIKSELINNLENEYIQGIKIKDLEEKSKNQVGNNSTTNQNLTK